MFHNGDFSIWGMHMLWWVIWLIFIIWIFATPWKIPGDKRRKDTPLEILQKRFALGELNKEEYEDRKKTLEER